MMVGKDGDGIVGQFGILCLCAQHGRIGLACPVQLDEGLLGEEQRPLIPCRVRVALRHLPANNENGFEIAPLIEVQGGPQPLLGVGQGLG